MIHQINKQLLLEDGAWDKTMRAKIQFHTNRDDAMSKIYQNNIGQYLLNPFVSGPLSHLGTKLRKFGSGLVYKTFKDKNSPNVTQATIQVDPKKGAFNADLDSKYFSEKEFGDNISKIREEHPFQYNLNPFTVGNVAELANNAAQISSSTYRGMTSPFSKTGDTIVKKQ